MLPVVIVLLVITLLVCVIMTGLLRSHADILRALHSLGVGVGDPADPHQPPGPVPVDLRAGPPLPSERSSTSAHDLEGVSPAGESLVVAMEASPRTLLAFLSTGCTSCARFWEELAQPASRQALPAGTRVVIVTKGPEWESPDAILRKAPPGITVVMSTQAWGDYEVPGSPYFALVDGASGRRIGEGVGQQWPQVVDLVNRADGDAQPPASRPPVGSQSRAAAVGLNGAEREAANDAKLLAAGITPGHPSLYPRSLEDLFASTAHLAGPDEEPAG